MRKEEGQQIGPRNKLNALELCQQQIEELENKKKINSISLEYARSNPYVSSLSKFMLHTSIIPIGIFVFIKMISITCHIDVPLIDSIPIKSGTILGLYFALPMTAMLGVFGLIGKKMYKHQNREIHSLEEIGEYLEEELAKKREEYEELSKNMACDTQTIDEDYYLRLQRRLDLIETLENYRAQVIAHYRRGTLEKYLKKIGVLEDIPEAMDLVEKRIVFKKTDTSSSK